MDGELIGVCGLLCNKCEAFLATEAGNIAQIEAIAARWSESYGTTITPDSVWCTGCVGPDPRKCSHTEECQVRNCAIERGIESCADCTRYTCAKLDAFLDSVPPDTRDRLEGMRPVF